MQAHSQTTGDSAAFGNGARLAAWVLAWMATLALARFGPAHIWDSQTVVSWAAILVNIVVGIGLIVVHARFLQKLDELQRKIMLDAMAVTLGVGLVAGCIYGAAANADVVSGDAEIGFLIILMGVVYMLAVLAGNTRYR